MSPTVSVFGLILLGWVWALLSVVAHMAWRADARQELQAIGIDCPPWWSREIFQTLMLLRDNRARLPERGEGLIRCGTFFCWNLMGVVFGIFTVVVVGMVRTRGR